MLRRTVVPANLSGFATGFREAIAAHGPGELRRRQVAPRVFDWPTARRRGMPEGAHRATVPDSNASLTDVHALTRFVT